MTQSHAVFWAAALMATTPALAAPITHNFSGIVDYNDFGAAGGVASGSITIDVDIFQINNVFGTEARDGHGRYVDPLNCPGCGADQTDPSQLAGSYSGGSQSIALGVERHGSGAGDRLEHHAARGVRRLDDVPVRRQRLHRLPSGTLTSVTTAAVPEPAGQALVAVAMLGAGAASHRRAVRS